MPTDKALLQVAANLRRLRLEKGMTQNTLATAAGMDDAEIRRIESARRDPGVKVLMRLARGLDVHPAEVFEGVE